MKKLNSLNLGKNLGRLEMKNVFGGAVKEIVPVLGCESNCTNNSQCSTTDTCNSYVCDGATIYKCGYRF